MAPPCKYLTKESRAEAARQNGNRYKNKHYLCEICEHEILLGNRTKHFKTKTHKLHQNLHDVICQNNSLRNTFLQESLTHCV